MIGLGVFSLGNSLVPLIFPGNIGGYFINLVRVSRKKQLQQRIKVSMGVE